MTRRAGECGSDRRRNSPLLCSSGEVASASSRPVTPRSPRRVIQRRKLRTGDENVRARGGAEQGGVGTGDAAVHLNVEEFRDIGLGLVTLSPPWPS